MLESASSVALSAGDSVSNSGVLGLSPLCGGDFDATDEETWQEKMAYFLRAKCVPELVDFPTSAASL